METARYLTKRLQQGDHKSLFTLMTLYYNDLYRYGIKFTADRDLTKDLIGQFFLHVWDHRLQFAGVQNVKGYLITSFRHFLLNYHRKISRQLELPETELVEFPYEEYLIASQENEVLRKTLQQAIESLSDRQRELIQMRYYELLSTDEISERTGLSLRTIYNKLHEALKKLRSNALVESIRKNQWLL
jgi:RNA polymerase sigma-70 factor (ECF subfamily)